MEVKLYFGYKPTVRVMGVNLSRQFFLLTLSLTFGLPARSEQVTDPMSHEPALRWSLQERVRGEWRENNTDFDSSTKALTDDEWLLQRLRVGVLWSPAPWFRLMVEGQDTREFFSDRPNRVGELGAEGDDALDLQQAFVEAGHPDSLSLRLGRQTLVYGDKRLISSAEWGNPTRVFDAAKMHLQREKWWVDAFAASVVQIEGDRFNRSDWLDSDSIREQIFSGIYFATSALDIQVTEAYLLGLHENHEDGRTGFYTLGTRMKADPAKTRGWEYDVEMAAQTGKVKGREHEAFAGHWGLTYHWLKHSWKPRLGIDYAYATGDGDPTDKQSRTFQNLFPTNHLYYGYMDLFAWQNLRNPAVHFAISPHKDVTVGVDWHWFWVDEVADSWYRASIRDTVRRNSPGESSYEGSEIDFTVNWKIHSQMELQAGYSHFFAGDYLAATGANDDADFAYLMLTFTY